MSGKTILLLNIRFGCEYFAFPIILPPSFEDYFNFHEFRVQNSPGIRLVGGRALQIQSPVSYHRLNRSRSSE